MAIVSSRQASHIELNLGNVFAVGLLSVLFVGAAYWTTNVAARSKVPVVKHLGAGGQYFLHAA